MANRTITLGTVPIVQTVFAYKNIPDQNETLEQTVQHWLGQTLQRDGFDNATINVTLANNNCNVDLVGPSDSENDEYARRLTSIVAIAWKAYSERIVNLIQKRKIWCTDNVDRPMWDPLGTNDWRFFMTLGVGLINHRSLQFFHYPPSRLLNPLRDSMMDPVTLRCRDLLRANGVPVNETKFYETRVNSTPIAAPDDQGTNFSVAADPVIGGLIPIGYFRDFEIQMIQTMIKPHKVQGYTIPMTAYGRDPIQQFGGLFLGPDQAMVIEVLPELKTPVLGSNHPYRFFGQAQTTRTPQPGQVIGSGQMLPGDAVMQACRSIQQDDLAVVRWQVQMANDPSLDPWDTIRESQAFWKAPEQQERVELLIKRHGSLTYDDYSPTSTTVSRGLVFGFRYDYDGNPQEPFGPDSH